MLETKVAKRYAKSLIDLASEKGVLDKVNQDMLLVKNTSHGNKELSLLLNNPTIKTDKKGLILSEIFKSSVDKLSLDFISIIVKKRRESYIPAIAEQFNEFYKEVKGIQTVTITSAIKLDEKLREEVMNIIKKHTDKTIDLIEKTDPSLIGGFVLQLGDKQVDASIASSLQRITHDLSGNKYILAN